MVPRAQTPRFARNCARDTMGTRPWGHVARTPRFARNCARDTIGTPPWGHVARTSRFARNRVAEVPFPYDHVAKVANPYGFPSSGASAARGCGTGRLAARANHACARESDIARHVARTPRACETAVPLLAGGGPLASRGAPGAPCGGFVERPILVPGGPDGAYIYSSRDGTPGARRTLKTGYCDR